MDSWPDQYVLTELQSRHLWQKIIHGDSATPELSLLHVQGAASHAFQAYQLIRQYHLPDEPAQFNNYSDETRIFRRWMTRYQDQLQEWQALDPAELLSALMERMDKGHTSIPEDICFYGFDEITPQMQAFLNSLKDKGVRIQFKPIEPSSTERESLKKVISKKQASLQKYEDANEEIKQCARWIRSIYKEGKTIGVVVPEMENYREINRKGNSEPSSLRQVFIHGLTSVFPSIFHWEPPLSHEPMIHLALLLLSQKGQRIPLLTFSTLITSPFLNCPDNEKGYRKKLDWNMRGKKYDSRFYSKSIKPF